MAQIATARTLAKGCTPILGLNSENRINEAIGALRVKFTDEELEYLESPYQAKNVLGFER